MQESSGGSVPTARTIHKPALKDEEKRLRNLKRLKDKYWSDAVFREESNRKNKLYRQKHKAELYEKEKKRRSTPEGKKKREEYSRNRYVQNIEHFKAYSSEYYKLNQQKQYEKHKNWVESNKTYVAAKRREWNKRNPDKVKLNRITHKMKLKEEVIKAYGGICQCCGETILDFLTIDHINGGGNAHRRELKNNGGGSFYSYLRKNNWPEGYQVLCFNCNMAKGFLGACPHAIPENTIAPL